MSTDYSHDVLFDGLKELAESAFPKRCNNCGRMYESAEAFLHETEHINETRTGLKQSRDDDGSHIVEVFRNCVCGSTLMDFFGDRRDLSEKGEKRRKKFNELLTYLQSQGLEADSARAELIKLLKGEQSELLKPFFPDMK